MRNNDFYNKNLTSIKLDSEEGNQFRFLKKIFLSYCKLSQSSVIIECSRPTYEYDLNVLFKDIENFCKNKKSYFLVDDIGIRFWENNFRDLELLDIIPKIWVAYEHVSVCFSNSEIGDYNNYYRKPWYEIVQSLRSYVLFKGVEEDVIWIGKSEELEFKEIM